MIGTMVAVGVAYIAGGGWNLTHRPIWVDALGLVIPLTVVFLAWRLYSNWRHFPDRGALTVAPDRSAFIVTSPTPEAASITLALGLLAKWGAVHPSQGWSWDSWLALAAAVALGVACIAGLVRFAIDRPLIEVRPDGVRVTGPFTSGLVPWGDLTRSTIADQLDRAGGGWIWSIVRGRAQFEVRGVIEHYLAHPERQSAIGTVEEYQRLQADGILPA